MRSATKNDREGTWSAWHSPEVPIRLAASGCLLGEEVRFDGGHAKNRFVATVLGEWVEWTSLCPESDIGMGVPRPTVRLVDEGEGVRMIAPSTGEDFTDRMRSYSRGKVADLADVDGFVGKKRSPSCGLERLRIYSMDGHFLRKNGTGLFTEELVRRYPNLPVEEEGRLSDARLRENFIERVFARNRWRALVANGLSRPRLVEFHTAHKLLLRSHNEAGYQRLGRLVAAFGSRPDEEIYAEYETEFQNTLRSKTTTKRHTNVLQHALGYLKNELDPREKRVILTAVEDYRLGRLPLVVPVTLIRMGIVRHEIDYLSGQLYFDPHPKELMLRNHV